MITSLQDRKKLMKSTTVSNDPKCPVKGREYCSTQTLRSLFTWYDVVSSKLSHSQIVVQIITSFDKRACPCRCGLKWHLVALRVCCIARHEEDTWLWHTVAHLVAELTVDFCVMPSQLPPISISTESLGCESWNLVLYLLGKSTFIERAMHCFPNSRNRQSAPRKFTLGDTGIKSWPE